MDLYEVRLRRVLFKPGMVDGDRLHDRVPAGTETVPQRAEVRRPVGAPDGLDHLHRDDPVKGSARIAVILVARVDLVRQTVTRREGLHVRQLVCRKGQAGDMGADALGNPGRQGTPTDTDLQDTVPGLGIHQIHHPVEFGRLGLLQGRLGTFEDRRRVDHRLVKPLGIELVPQIVMCRDVASAPGLGVCPQAMGHPVEGASRAEPIDRLVEGFPVPCHHLDHRSKIGCGPVAAHVRLGKGHVARE